MHRPFGIPVRLLIAAFAAALTLQTPVVRGQVEGGPKDGGAWRAGDFWRFNRQFHLRMNDVFPGSPGTITFNERFTKTVDVVTPVIEASNSLDGPQRVYVRNRSASTMSGSGLWFIPTGVLSNLASASVQFTVLPGTASSGFDWRRVSDLAEMRESFTVNGTIRARLTAFTTLGTRYDNMNFQIVMSVSIDNGPALEYADFPLDQIGETWIMAPLRRTSDAMTIAIEDISVSIITVPVTTVTYPLDTTARQTFIQDYSATGQSVTLLGGGTFGGTERINANSITEGDTLYWSGTAKEFVDHTTGNSPVLTTLFGFRTSLSGTGAADYTVAPDSVISNVAFNPTRPGYNGAFQMTFSGGPATIILRDHAGNQQALPAATSPVVLTAPPINDDSPTSGVNQDFGSYGVEFIVGGHNVELATVRLSSFNDCNSNGIPDSADIAAMTSMDCNLNGVPDECEPDCNSNGIADACDIAAMTSDDCNLNGVPDECDADCNTNGIPDECDIAAMTSTDCNLNGVPDECDLASMTSLDCNSNGIPDECDIASMTSFDCNLNGVPDECDFAAMTSQDCNSNGIPDECDIASMTSQDCNSNGVPDECDITSMTSLDCNSNGVPDECEPDCNSNSIPDDCDIASMTSPDCNSNGVPDECDIADMTSTDLNLNGIPDDCEPPPTATPTRTPTTTPTPTPSPSSTPTPTSTPTPLPQDCNANGTPDAQDIAGMTSQDCNADGIPDECQLDAPYPVTLQAVDRGWWRMDGLHASANNIVYIGQETLAMTWRYNSYLIFDISNLSPASIATVRLRLEVVNFNGPDPQETVGVYDVSTPASVLEADGSGQTGIYADLGSGTQYGSFAVFPADVGNTITVPLGPQARSDLFNALAVGAPRFSVGLHNETIAGPESDSVRLTTGNEYRVLELAILFSGDCNLNGSPDGCDIAAMTSIDLDSNGIPDECEPLSSPSPTASPSPTTSPSPTPTPTAWCVPQGTLGMSDRGRWDATGFHSPANQGTLTGTVGGVNGNTFFVFDRTQYGAGAATLTLRLEAPSPSFYFSADPSETIGVYDVSTPVAQLVAGGSGRTDIFDDLGSGQSYGSFITTAGQAGSVISIPLNAQAVADFNAAPGLFAVGLHLETDSAQATEAVRFSNNNEFRVHEIVVTGADCNANMVLDACDIANMTSLDANMNGIPDECEAPPSPSPSPAAPSPSPTPVCCPGDADNSGGSVNAQDFLAVQANFGLNNGTGGLGDADCSGGSVNAGDFLAVQANFGLSCG